MSLTTPPSLSDVSVLTSRFHSWPAPRTASLGGIMPIASFGSCTKADNPYGGPAL